VVVIDDEPLVRWSLVAGLRHAGFDAVGAASPEEARRPGYGAPDVVLLDVQLWGRDPQHLLDEVRALSSKSRILLLAVEGQDVPLRGWNDVDVIRKPFDLNAVVRRVEAVLACPQHDVRIAI
jgi:DNA-binding response OmpR family regulator